ncbi:TonB-dependent receptor-like protein [Novosphingobium sp. PhB165]|nr:TonB-dependent receptor-like protein [Novosphingobium sp. PhB165]
MVLGFALFSTAVQAQDAAAADTAPEANAPIVVTGSRIASPNQTSIAPITTVTAQDFQLSGTTRAEDLLNSLPQVTAGQSSNLSNGATGTATVDLRGLGPSRTLVLINGRRLMTGDPNSTTSAADLNFIPAALVKRVDVLTGGASATYGADAVAGVVNFQMDTDFEGFRVDANYGLYTHSNGNDLAQSLLNQNAGNPDYTYPTGNNADGGQYDATVAFGTKFDDGRGHATAYVGYRRATPVLQGRRDYSSCSITASRTGVLGCGGSPTANPGNVLIFDPSNLKSSTFGALGAGAVGAGTVAVGAPNLYNYAPLNHYQRPDERYTAGVFTDYEISNAIHPYMEFMFMDDRTVIGSRGELDKAWSYDAYYQYGRTNYSQVYSNEFSASRLANALDVVTDPKTGLAACRVTLTGQDPKCAPYDVFSGNISQAALDYLSATGFMKGQTSQQVASATFTGLLGEYGIKSPLASDGVNVAIGAEYRRDSLELRTDEAFSTGDLTGQGAPTLDTDGSYKVSELFGEIEVPLIQDGFVQSLSFNGGYRYSHYSISNGRTFNTNTYKLGLELAPISDIRLRAGYNRAVRVPNIQELFSPQIIALDGTTDPCAGEDTVSAACAAQGVSGGTSLNPASQYNGLIGGNPDLNPEKSTTKTLGVVLAPHWIPGLTGSVDWFDIKVKDAIQQFGADAILAACEDSDGTADACSLIHRNPAGSLWLSSDGYVEDIYHNVGSVKTRGFEFNGNYTTEIGGAGRLSLNFVGTYLNHYTVDNGLTADYNCAGYYGPTCGTPLPKWRHKFRTSFNMANGLGLSVQWRHLSGVTTEFANPSSTLQDSRPQQQNSLDTKIKSQDYFDLTLTAALGDHLTWRLGATNLFDKDPPLVTSIGCASTVCSGNTYPGTYDALGRYVFTGITMNF